MTIEERKQRILARIEEMKAEGLDMKAGLAVFGVTENAPETEVTTDG